MHSANQPEFEAAAEHAVEDLNRIVTDKAPARDMALALRKAEIELNL